MTGSKHRVIIPATSAVFLPDHEAMETMYPEPVKGLSAFSLLSSPVKKPAPAMEGRPRTGLAGRKGERQGKS